MTLTHTPLDPSQLSAEARRALGSGPAKMMAARGMAPLSDPRDLVTVLYQLSIDTDSAVREAASTSASDLPERMLAAALADPGLDPRVLDFFARRLRDAPALLETIVLNQATADATIAWLAGVGGQREVDVIAQNEQRLLRHPEIVAAMYTNRNARMSTVDRVVELAVRNEVKVPGIAAWDEICRSLLQSGKDAAESEQSDEDKDRVFAAVARVNAEREGSEDEAEEAAAKVEEAPMSIRDMTVPMKIRLATLGNKFDRSMLIRDGKKMVAMAAIKAPGVTDSEAAKYASNNSLVEEVIGYIASRRDWIKQYGTKVALVQNPKTPLPAAMRLMTHLREKDIRLIARSKGVPSALAAQARKLLSARSSRGG